MIRGASNLSNEGFVCSQIRQMKDLACDRNSNWQYQIRQMKDLIWTNSSNEGFDRTQIYN